MKQNAMSYERRFAMGANNTNTVWEEMRFRRKKNDNGIKFQKLQIMEANKEDIDFHHSLMFGDRATDEAFAKNLGVRFVPINTNGSFVVPRDP